MTAIRRILVTAVTMMTLMITSVAQVVTNSGDWRIEILYDGTTIVNTWTVDDNHIPQRSGPIVEPWDPDEPPSRENVLGFSDYNGMV